MSSYGLPSDQSDWFMATLMTSWNGCLEMQCVLRAWGMGALTYIRVLVILSNLTIARQALAPGLLGPCLVVWNIHSLHQKVFPPLLDIFEEYGRELASF